MDVVKRCSGKCGQLLPRGQFYRFVRQGEKVRYSGKCILCTAEYVKARYHARTPDERKEQQRKNTEWMRQKRIKEAGMVDGDKQAARLPQKVWDNRSGI